MHTSERLESRLLFNAGDIDPTFGDGVGPVFTDFGNSADTGLALVLLDDGRFLVGGDIGQGADTHNTFGVARYLADGSLDTTFGGGDGRATVDFGIDPVGTDDDFGGMAVAPDGRIVLAGTAGVSGGGYRDVAVARLTPDGELDTTFGGDGKVTTGFSNATDSGRNVAVQPDGKIVVAGWVSLGTQDMLLVRYNVDGSLDAGFADGGRFISDSGGNDSLNDVMVQPDGKIFAVGGSGRPTRYGQSYTLRLNPDGSPDTTYNLGGGSVLDFGNTSAAFTAIRLPDGSYAVGGWANTRKASDSEDHLNFAIARVRADGQLDTGFGTGGKTTVPHTDGGGDRYSLARQSDGKLILASSVNPDNDGFPLRDYAALVRFLPNGKIDTTFGAVGVKLVTLPGVPSFMEIGGAADIALTADERILLAGIAFPPSSGNSDFWIRRLLDDVGPYEVSGTVFRDDNADGVRDPAEPGMAGWRVYQDLNQNGKFDAGVEVFDRNVPPPPTVPTGLMAMSSIEVTGMGPDLADVDVTVNLTRRTDRWLGAQLLSPAGTWVQLFSDLRPGGDRLTNTTLDDEAATSIVSGTAPFTGHFRPQQPLSALDHQDPRGFWTLYVSDSGLTNAATIESWSMALTTGGEPNVMTAQDGTYSFINQPAGDHVIRAEPQPRFTQTAPDGRAYSFRLPEDDGTPRDFGFQAAPDVPFVVGRYVFYNNSRFDGHDVTANRADDTAIATDKVALEPGGAASFQNVTGYSRGINGVMVDLTTRYAFFDDVRFSFDVGTGGERGTWRPAPEPLSITRRTGRLPLDIARMTFIWTDGAIKNKWLRVTAEATFEGSVVDTDVFYFGNLVGETDDLRVTAADFSRTRAAVPTRGAAVDNPFDHNRDGFVNVLDTNIVRGNLFAALAQPVTAPVPGTAFAAANSRSRYRPGLIAALASAR